MAHLLRLIRLIAWFVFGVLIAAVWLVPGAMAETCANGVCTQPATQNPLAATKIFQAPPSNNYSTQSAAAQQVCSFNGVPNGPYTWVEYGAPVYRYYGKNAGGTTVYCGDYSVTFSCPSGSPSPAGSNYYDKTCSGYSYSCPANQGWTLSGTNCTRPQCTYPQTNNPSTGVCEKLCTAGNYSTATRYTGTFSMGGGNKPTTGTATPIPATLCDGSCTGTVGPVTDCNSSGVVGTPVTCTYQVVMTGASCTGGNGSAPTYDPCYSQGKVAGTLNGQPICTGTAPTTSTTTKTSTTPTSTTNVSTTTVCDGAGSCTTTNVSSTTSGGSGPNGTGPGSTVAPGTPTTEKEDQPSFCTENPNSVLCKVGTFGGSCAPGAEPSCDGDAIQCAQARAAWRIQCDLTEEPTDAQYTLGKSIATGGADPVVTPIDPSQVTAVDVASIVSNAAIQRTLSESCIPNQTFVVAGHSFTFDTTLFCSFASVVGYLMVAASSVIAIRMVVSGGAF